MVGYSAEAEPVDGYPLQHKGFHPHHVIAAKAISVLGAARPHLSRFEHAASIHCMTLAVNAGAIRAAEPMKKSGVFFARPVGLVSGARSAQPMAANARYTSGKSSSS